MESTALSSDWVPFFQTLVWAIMILLMVLLFWKRLVGMIDNIIRNIRKGSSLKAGLFELGAPPSIRATTDEMGVSVEGRSGGDVSVTLEKMLLDREFPSQIAEDIYLMHEVEVLQKRTTPGTGRYRLRIWVAAYDRKQFENIERVTYRLWDDFPKKVISTQAKELNFELWLNSWGEFTIIACVERKDMEPLWLTRYLDMHSR